MRAAPLLLLTLGLLGAAPALAQSSTPSSTQSSTPTGLDDDPLSRALERSLSMNGALVIPRATFEIEPNAQASYQRRESLALVDTTLATRDDRSADYLMGLRFRAGLPYASQVELSLPYGRQSRETVFGGVQASTRGSGWGDVQVGLSKQLLNEAPGRPGLVGNVTWQHAASDAPAAIANRSAGFVAATPTLGAGYDALLVALTAVKRADPVVFVGSLSRSFNRSAERDGIRFAPADTQSASLRAVLAASPEVALRTGFWISHSGDARVNGQPVPGSKQTAALLELGGAFTLGRRTLIDLTVGVGLTTDAPDFLVALAIPIRF